MSSSSNTADFEDEGENLSPLGRRTISNMTSKVALRLTKLVGGLMVDYYFPP